MSSASIGSGSHAAAGVLHQPVVPVVAALLDVHREARRLVALHDDDVRIDGVSFSASSAICLSGTS